MEPIIRSRTSLLSFLTPCASSTRRPSLYCRQSNLLCARVKVSSRSIFAPTACRNADTPSTAADEDSPATRPLASPRRSTGSSSKASNQSIDKLLSLFVRPSKEAAQNSASITEAAYGKSSTRYREPPNVREYYDKKSIIYDEMEFPASPPTSDSSSSPIPVKRPAIRNKHTIRSRPTVGRTIELNPNIGLDFGRAINRLGMLVARNSIRKDLKMQKYHERPGLKRKRLKSERWRRLFKEGFQATVRRVKEMRRKGW